MKLNFPVFLVFEGIDGSGKSTLCGKVYSYFIDNGIQAITDREPTSGRWGKQIRDMLQHENANADEMLELFLKDREDDVIKNVLPALSSGKSVIMDRYYYSNAAYQGAMGISPSDILKENTKRKFPEPDRIYLIDIDPEAGLERVRKRNNIKTEIFENTDFLRHVMKIYHSLINDKFIVLDGTKKPDEILAVIIKDITDNFAKNENILE